MPRQQNENYCRMCKMTGSMQSIGSLPDLDHFAGRKLDSAMAGGQLQRCVSCKSMQRHPIYEENTYGELYAKGAGGTWVYNFDRNDGKYIREYLVNSKCVDSVLDVGCSHGDLLNSLPQRFTKFGIEPSEESRSVCNANGIALVGRSLDDVGPGQTFDCIMAVDVIEHVPQPREFLNKMNKLISPSGIIIISTGNPEYKRWYERLKAKFYYSSFPEHLSFPSKEFLRLWAAENGYELVFARNFKYFDGRWLKSFASAALQYSFIFSPTLHRWTVGLIFNVLRGQRNFSGRSFFLPCAGLFADHHLCVLTKCDKKTETKGTRI
jgi:SAM-dependent methyltransferase